MLDVWQAELAAGQQALEQKIAILALMTLIFNRAGDERVLEFGDIVQASTTGTLFCSFGLDLDAWLECRGLGAVGGRAQEACVAKSWCA